MFAAVKPFGATLTRTVGSFLTAAVGSTAFVRTKMKTNHSAAKRFRKTADGYKRGIPGRSHGNIGWSMRMLNQKTGVVHVAPKGRNHGKLKKLLPYW